MGEFGATLMVAGNIPGRTRTLTTAIYTAVDAGHMALAWAWTGSIVVMSFGRLLNPCPPPRQGLRSEEGMTMRPVVSLPSLPA